MTDVSEVPTTSNFGVMVKLRVWNRFETKDAVSEDRAFAGPVGAESGSVEDLEALIMKVAGTSETSVNFNHDIRRYSSENSRFLGNGATALICKS